MCIGPNTSSSSSVRDGVLWSKWLKIIIIKKQDFSLASLHALVSHLRSQLGISEPFLAEEEGWCETEPLPWKGRANCDGCTIRLQCFIKICLCSPNKRTCPKPKLCVAPNITTWLGTDPSSCMDEFLFHIVTGWVQWVQSCSRFWLAANESLLQFETPDWLVNQIQIKCSQSATLWAAQIKVNA